MNIGFLFEAYDKNELPEQMALCVRITKLNMNELELLNDILEGNKGGGNLLRLNKVKFIAFVIYVRKFIAAEQGIFLLFILSH